MSVPTDEPKKRWQHGRVVMQRKPIGFYCTLVLIILVSTLFFALDCPYLVAKLNACVPVFGGLLCVFLLGCLLRTSWSDPGILPRATPDEAAFVEAEITRSVLAAQNAIETGSAAPALSVPRVRDVQIRGRPVQIKYCNTCKMFRPPRCSHCAICDNCIERFDHHCPWVGNCVGRRNYRYFYMFLVGLTVYSLYILGFGITALVLRTISTSFVDALRDGWQSAVEIIVGFPAFLTGIGLASYHTYLICGELSTNEYIKSTYEGKTGSTSPFNRGSRLKNFISLLCPSPYPSVLNLRKPQVLRADETAKVQKIIKDYRLADRSGAQNNQPRVTNVNVVDRRRTRVTAGDAMLVKVHGSSDQTATQDFRTGAKSSGITQATLSSQVRMTGPQPLPPGVANGQSLRSVGVVIDSFYNRASFNQV